MKKLSYKIGRDYNTYFVDDEIFVVPNGYRGEDFFTLEYGIIQKIRKNEEGYFDFSKNIIDIGAYVGAYSMLLDFKECYCFEPNVTTSALIWTNAYIYEKTETTHVFNTALSEKEEVVQYDGFNCNGSQMTVKWVGDSYKDGEVPILCKTLDSYNIKDVGLIKIDTEGFEEKVIRGGLLTIISNNYPPILFECWDADSANMPKEKHDSLFNLLKTLGYEIFEYWGDFETHLAVHKSQLKK